MRVSKHTHKRETCRKRNIVFLDKFLVRLVENLDKLSLRTHCQDKILSFSNAVTFNTYNGTIKGKFDSTGTTVGAAFANLVLPRVSKGLVSDDSRFSVFVLSDSFLRFSLCLWVHKLSFRVCSLVVFFYSAFLSARF